MPKPRFPIHVSTPSVSVITVTAVSAVKLLRQVEAVRALLQTLMPTCQVKLSSPFRSLLNHLSGTVS